MMIQETLVILAILLAASFVAFKAYASFRRKPAGKCARNCGCG